MPQDGRVSVRRGEESIDVRIAILPTTHGEKVTLRILSQGEAPESLDDARDVATKPCRAAAGDLAAVRRRRRRRADRLRQDDDALHLPAAAQHAGSTADDDRGSRRVPRRRPRSGRGQPAGRAHVRQRPADRPPLRSGRAARRRDPRRGNGADRVPRVDDRPPRPDDAARSDRGVGDPAADRHEHRAEHPRDVDQLHRRATTRPPRVSGMLRETGAGSRAAPRS